MKKKIAFISINALLVLIVGLILGLCLPLGSSNALLLSFILLLVTLATPTFLFLTVKNAASPIGITSIVFMVGNLVTLITFMFLVNEIKVVGITEAAIVGTYLIIILICVACLPNKKENK